MRVYKKTDIGLRRTSNQDFCDGGVFPDGNAWIVVCDGVGGANGGNIASALAIQTICDVLFSQYKDQHGCEVEALLQQAVSAANAAVYEASRKDSQLSGMGTTVVAAIIKDGKAHIIHVGDSRAYMIRSNYAEQLTVDHSMVQELVLMGKISPDEAATHPWRNVITRALGSHETVEAEYDCVPFEEKDKLLLCTDGLSIYADEEDIYRLAKNKPASQIVNDLVEMALDAGGSDNVTVAVAENGDTEE